MKKEREEKFGDDDFITWSRLHIVYNNLSAIQKRLNVLEKKQDDWKVWLEGFKEGFTIRNKKEKK